MQIAMISALASLLSKKQRKSDRRRVTLPVSVLGVNVKATERDLSFSGVYFETTARFDVGSTIKMTIELDNSSRTQLECEGIVVRVERSDSKVGVAARINSKTAMLTAKS